jgi:hypothetical protein
MGDSHTHARRLDPIRPALIEVSLGKISHVVEKTNKPYPLKALSQPQEVGKPGFARFAFSKRR